MKAREKRPVGRPMFSRERRGYEADLAHLGRLRSACLVDGRLSTRQYAVIVQAIAAVERLLRKLPKARKARKAA